jgi:hypothetical protein
MARLFDRSDQRGGVPLKLPAGTTSMSGFDLRQAQLDHCFTQGPTRAFVWKAPS